jgi:hypothetical protein
MPKSRKRRNAKPKRDLRTVQRKLTAPMPSPRPKHPGYTQPCPADQLIDEFGEEGAQWLTDEYERPLTVADFHLEQAIRRDEFILDDPFTGPATCTASQVSKTIEMSFQVLFALADKQGVLTPEMSSEIEECGLMESIDHDAEGADAVRQAHLAGAIYLNDRGMWDFPGDEA